MGKLCEPFLLLLGLRLSVSVSPEGREKKNPQQPQWLINIQAVYVFFPLWKLLMHWTWLSSQVDRILPDLPGGSVGNPVLKKSLSTEQWVSWSCDKPLCLSCWIFVCFFYASVFCVFLYLCRRSCTASTRCCPQSTSVGAACWSNGSTSQFSRSAGRTEQRWRVHAGPPLTKPSVHRCSFSWWLYFSN